jgi:hypothetical protein
MGSADPTLPILCEGQSEKGRSPVPWEVWELRPYERSPWTARTLEQRSPQTSCAARRTRAWLHDQSLQALGIG